ncbi:hypothetical protein PYW08_011415 [Mythimna loreyi]|uniref:Uncharacterized protein n=1 Tax=Mythimna loreyi TaxID=667449 RepID=A0ACC2Q4J3_9NEOP|nr:hypothetical protein PYW08_011415 [Mythimna loreyi]
MHLSAHIILDFGYSILNNTNTQFVMESNTMPPPKSSFVVVECQTAPNNGNKLVCVPKSWIQHEISEKKVAIAYPAEDETSIAKRINNNEPADGAWEHYIGELKYEAASYEKAVVGFLTNGENGKQIEEKSCKNDAAAIPKDSLKLRIVVPKLNLKPDKKYSLKKHLKKHTKNKIHKSKHRNEENKSLKKNKPDLKKDSRKHTSSNGIQSKETKEFSSHCQNNVEASQKSLESKIEDVIVGSLQETLKQLNNNNLNTDTSKNSLSGGLDFELDKEIDLSNLDLTPEDKRKLLTLDIDQRHTLGYIKAVLINIKTLYLKVIENKKILNSIVSKYKKVQPTTETNLQNGHVEEESEQSDDMETLRFDELDSDDVFENEKDLNERNDNSKINIKHENLLEEIDTKMQNDSDFETFIDDEESSLDSFPSSPKVVKHKKNYNKQNSTWTLKHPNPGKGLVPLGSRDSRVYVSAKALEEIKRTSDSLQMFTRLLFKEVFTAEALKTCSMTGKKPTGNGSNTNIIRPALNARARTVIINYSVSYGKQVGWKEIKLTSLVQSLRSFLQRSRGDRRRKRGKIIRE